MALKKRLQAISNRTGEYNNVVKAALGKKSEFEVTLKALKALFDFANGIKQTANITNQQLSQNAKDGLQYMQDIAQLIQDIKAAKAQLDADLEVIEATDYGEEEEPISNIPPPNGEVIS